ncbi:prominin-1-A isoform X3 [Anabrus simplex]|uniref:prominin-1-A isoform X3 n=1 Tax=Anabrus simplex TaxID=316456 RepID=UPI0035A35750
MSSFGFTSRRRTSKCVCCGCVWLLVLVIVQQCSGSESEEQHVNYTTPKLDLSYNSSTEFNAKAMEQLYYVTNFFIDLIQRKEIYPEDLLEDENGRFTTDKLVSDWPLLARHYAGVVSVALVGLVFVVLMPLVALVFCCCRCAGRCGGRAQPFEKRRDPCRRITLGIILSAVAIIILYGVVCAFVTNEYMEDGIKNLPSKLNIAVNDAHLYLNNTMFEVKFLLLDNFLELKSSLENDLNSASVDLTDQLKNKTSLAGALESLTRFGEGLQSIAQDVNNIQILTKELKKEANDVNLILVEIKDNLTRELKNCLGVPSCNETYYQVYKMSNPANFSELPDITEKISDVNSIHDIETGINNGKKAYEDIQKNITDIVEKYKPDILQTLSQAGDGIKEKSTDINNLVNNATVAIDRESEPVIKDLDGYIKEYSQYRYYVDISVSSVMLLILLCITLGLFYGFCGKRPDSGYDEDCCNKATGASFLMFGVYVMFIFSAVLMLITLVHFLLGVAAEKAVCQTLRQPEDSQVLAMLTKKKLLNIGYTADTNVNLNISTVISSCHANDSLYNVLQVSNALNISEVLNYPEKFGILEKIRKLKENIKIPVNFELLNETTREKLSQLGGESLDLKPLNDELSSVDKNVSLLKLANNLNETAERPDLDKNTQKSLRSYSEQLRKLHTEKIQEILVKAGKLNETAHALEENMQLFESVNKTLDEIEEAQKLLNSSKVTEEMSQLVDAFANGTMEKVNGYLRRVVHDFTTNVGSCEPLSQIYNSSVVFTCNDILDPFNGFWASIGWCLVLFIPAIILSVKLASLYRKSESYHAAIPDTEYLYDAYADRDNIPLANGPDKKNHHRRYNETYDNSSGYMGDYSSHMGRGDRERRERGGSAYHPEDARYNDMAPKYTPLGSFLERLKSKIRKTPKEKSAEHSEKLDKEKYYTLSGLPKLTMDMLGSVKKRISSAPRMKVMLDSFKELPRLSFGSLKFAQPRTPRASEFA